MPDFHNLATVMSLDAGVTCLDAEELVDHVTTWLGTDRISTALTIEVHGSPYFARTVWFRILRGETTVAERRFEPAPARCADLHAAVGLAIALALKASLLDSLLGAHAGAELNTNQRFQLTAQALGGIAALPGPDFGIALSLQYAVAERFAARLSGLALLAPYGDFQRDQGRFKTQLAIARLDICSRLADLDSLHISACVGIAAGALYASGEAFPMSRRALIAYLAVANALELDLELSAHWSITLAIDVLVPLRRTSFVVRDQNDTITAENNLATAGAVIAIGPSYHF